MANFLNKKRFIYNIIESSFPVQRSRKLESIDEIVEQNTNSASGSIGFKSIYNYYNSDKVSLFRIEEHWDLGYYYSRDYHDIRPLFLFKE